MISAIEKEDVLPGAMIRDVLVQNPQAPKSKKVMEALDQRQDSIPEYMMEEILQGLNTYGAKELLEQELGSHIANILWDIKHDTIGLDSLRIQILLDLAGSYQTIPGLYASNILIKERLLNYNEPVYLVDPLKNMPVQNQIHQCAISNHYLKVFPNPAGNYFIAYYFLDEQEYPGILSISDYNGRKLKSIQLKDKQNQVVFTTEELSAGIYLVSLIGRNHLIDSQKLTLIK